MKGVQPPVEPPPAGRFAFFLHLLRKILTITFFPGFFLLFKQPKNSKNNNELFGCLKERKKSRKKIESKFLKDDEEKKAKLPTNGGSTGG